MNAIYYVAVYEAACHWWWSYGAHAMADQHAIEQAEGDGETSSDVAARRLLSGPYISEHDAVAAAVEFHRDAEFDGRTLRMCVLVEPWTDTEGGEG